MTDPTEAALRAIEAKYLSKVMDGQSLMPFYPREDVALMISAAVKAEREAFSAKAREFAANYPEASDGRNTFIILAEWIESRSAVNP